MVQGFRASGPLSRAAMQYAEQHPQADFVRKTGASEANSFQRMVDTFLIGGCRSDTRIPNRPSGSAFSSLPACCASRHLRSDATHEAGAGRGR